jgi:ferritin-like metal-binding protein YciE
MKMATDSKSLYVTSLRNTHALESQGLQQMESQVGGLENYPEYERLLRDHIEVTRRQLQRLDDALGAVGESRSALKEAVTNTAGRIGAAVHALAQDETLKNLYAGYAYQYHQISAYRSLIVFAEKAGQTDHVAGFKQAIEEETRGAQGVDGLIETVTRQYIERTLSGKKADS